MADDEQVEGLESTFDHRLRGLLEALPDLLLVVSSDNVFMEYHAPDPDILLMPPSAFIGRRVDEVMPPDVVGKIRRVVAATLADRRSHTLEYSLDQPGGRRWYEARSALYDSDSVIFVIRDRTAQVRIEEQLRLADRMASVGNMAAGIAHEINNPLTYVLGNLQLARSSIARGEANSAKALAALEEAVEGVQRVNRLVRDLRGFSHPGTDKQHRVDLVQVLDSTLRIAEKQFFDKARLVRDMHEVPNVLGHEGRLGQVVLNLLSNAAAAIDDAGEGPHEIRVRTHTEDGEAIVEISDTGPGLPEDLGTRIFEPFVTTKAVGEGTGLGLSICRNIVFTMGGSITAKPGYPRGATFRIRLPPYDESRQETPKPKQSTKPSCQGRVLVVDDDPRVARVTAGALSDHDVTELNDPTEALRRLVDGAQFDVVVCDLMMPRLSGTQLYKKAIERRPDLANRFVFITGAGLTPDTRIFIEKTERPLLHKPFDLRELREMVDDYIRR